MKGKCGIDIISNKKFTQANEIFQAGTKQGKDERCGKTMYKVPSLNK